ncbi:KAT8 regulatory NSL complex subunit 3 [Trichinella pseudospiralis]|uniref:KAT8 regulatory NSL complex subunit 3 n=1 Tax=Trichinella pseudospiralis TaxID=6337 RepID=A0A0V1K915_TRIPS|nr:KAT8 regulatory NSL complex subunit 3 [Trichinella pseudospiralis]
MGSAVVNENSEMEQLYGFDVSEILNASESDEPVITLYEALQRNFYRTRFGMHYYFAGVTRNEPSCYSPSLLSDRKAVDDSVIYLFPKLKWPPPSLNPLCNPVKPIEHLTVGCQPQNTVTDISIAYLKRWAEKAAKQIRISSEGTDYDDTLLYQEWEDKILEILSNVNRKFIIDICQVIKSYVLFELASAGVYNEELMLSENLKTASLNMLTIWNEMMICETDLADVHYQFLKNLPEKYLNAYLCITRTMRYDRPDIFKKIINVDENCNTILAHFAQFSSIRSVNGTKVSFPLKVIPPLDGSVVIILVWPNVRFVGYQSANVSENCNYFFGKVLTEYAKCIELKTVPMKWGKSTNEIHDIYMDDLKIKIFKALQRNCDKKVILIGWHLSCDVVLQSCSASNVCGVILFNFINRAKEHLPGIMSHSLLECEVPVLFVVGSLSRLCSVDFLISILPKLKNPKCNIVVVGQCDDQLMMNPVALQSLHLSQLVVNYCILEAVMNYCHQLLKSDVKIVEECDDGDDDRATCEAHFEKCFGRRKQWLVVVCTRLLLGYNDSYQIGLATVTVDKNLTNHRTTLVDVFDPLRCHEFPLTQFEDVLATVDDFQRSVGQPLAYVACVQPAVLVDQCFRLFGISEIAAGQRVGTDADFTAVVFGVIVQLFHVDQFHFNIRDQRPDMSGFGFVDQRRSHWSDRFRLTITFDDHTAEHCSTSGQHFGRYRRRT